VAEHSRPGEHAQRAVVQIAQAAREERDHVVGVGHLGQPLAVEAPAPRRRIPCQDRIGDQGLEQPGQEEGVSAGLLVGHLGQPPAGVAGVAQGVGDQRAHVGAAERPQRERLHGGVLGLQLLYEGHQRVPGADLVVPVGADEQGVSGLGVGHQGPQQADRGHVGPLHVVQEDHQGAALVGEAADQPADHVREADLGLARRQRVGRRLGAEQQLGRRQDLDQQRPLRPQRLGEVAAPAGDGVLRLGEHPIDEVTQGLQERREGHAALVLIELPGEEDPAPGHDRAPQLVHQPRLPDAGVARDQDQLVAAGGGALERADQGGQLLAPAVEGLGHQKPRGQVFGAQIEEGVGAHLADPPQVCEQAAGGLVAILLGLGQQLEHDGREARRDLRPTLAGRERRPGDVRVHQLQAVLGHKGRPADQQVVEGGPQAVEIRARVQVPVGAAGLLGGDVAQRALELAHSALADVLAGELGGEPEVDQADLPGGLAPDRVGRGDVLVDHPRVVHPRQRGRHRLGHVQHPRDLGHAVGQHTVQRDRAGVFEHQGGLRPVEEVQAAHDPLAGHALRAPGGSGPGPRETAAAPAAPSGSPAGRHPRAAPGR